MALQLLCLVQLKLTQRFYSFAGILGISLLKGTGLVSWFVLLFCKHQQFFFMILRRSVLEFRPLSWLFFFFVLRIFPNMALWSMWLEYVRPCWWLLGQALLFLFLLALNDLWVHYLILGALDIFGLSSINPFELFCLVDWNTASFLCGYFPFSLSQSYCPGLPTRIIREVSRGAFRSRHSEGMAKNVCEEQWSCFSALLSLSS